MYAVINKYIDIINVLIEIESIDVNIQNQSGNTALLLAMDSLYSEESESIEIVDLLLSKNDINVNIKNELMITTNYFFNETPLIKAVKKNNLRSYKSLSKKEGIDFNQKDDEGQTIVHLAARSKNKELIKEIVNNEKVDVNIKNDRSKSSLHVAIDYENFYLLSLLIQNKKIDLNLEDADGMTPLMKVILKIDDISSYSRYYGREENGSQYEQIAISLINDERIDLSKKDERIFFNHFYGIFIIVFYNNYLHIACKKQKSNIVAVLISKGVNINDKNILNIKNFNDEGIFKMIF